MIYLLDVTAAKALTIVFTLMLIIIPIVIGVWIYRLGKKDKLKNQNKD